MKVYLDEDVHHLIAHALRHRGWDALTTIDAARQGTDDLDQIHYATRLGYTILSYNVTDFPRLHGEILSAGDHHAGIIVATSRRRRIRPPTQERWSHWSARFPLRISETSSFT